MTKTPDTTLSAKTPSKKPDKTYHKTAGKAPNKTASNPPKVTPATGTALAANRSIAPDITPAGNTPPAARSIPYAELHELLACFMQGKPGSNEPAHTTPVYIHAGHATTSPSHPQSEPAASRSGHSPAPDGGDGLHAFITLLRDWGDHLRFISRLDLVQASPELIATGRAFYNSFTRAAEDPLSALDPQEDDIEMQLLVAYCRLQLETGLDFDRLHQLNEPIAQLCGLFFYLGYCYCVYEPHNLRGDWRYSLLQDLFGNGGAANKKQSNMSAAGKENGDKSECNKVKAYKAKSGNGAKEQDANR